MNGILGQQVAERTALFRPGRSTAQAGMTQQANSQQMTPAAVHRVHSAPSKSPEPVCIFGCCGFGKISILWTVSIRFVIIIVVLIIIVNGPHRHPGGEWIRPTLIPSNTNCKVCSELVKKNLGV